MEAEYVATFEVTKGVDLLPLLLFCDNNEKMT